jgi:predicted transglutaminase-like cysteine proteinase
VRFHTAPRRADCASAAPLNPSRAKAESGGSALRTAARLDPPLLPRPPRRHALHPSSRLLSTARAALPLLLRVVVFALLWAGGPALQAWDADRMLRAADRLGPRALASVRLLQPLMRDLTALDEATRLARVNEFFNRRIVAREDHEVWGLVDHWASPLETLDKGEGDCEDYAVAKYFTLLATGMPVQRLRLVYVQAQQGGPGGPSIAHMVLAYYASPAAEPLILDSLITELRPAGRRPDLRPVFSFNGEGLWQGAGPQPVADALSGLSRWREVQAKARAEGFL